MPDRITASVVVELEQPGAADEARGHLSAQVDDRPDGLNAGRTQFYRDAPASMAPGFLVWRAGLSSVTIEAVHGTVSAVGQASTTHSREVVEYAQPGQTEIEVQLDTPARSLPTMTVDYGAWSIQVGGEYADGTLRSVRLVRATADQGGWCVVKLEWTARADCYRVIPTSGAEYVMLLVSGAVEG